MKLLKILIPLVLIGAGAWYYYTMGPGANALLGTWSNDETTLIFNEDSTWESHTKHDLGLVVWGTYSLNGSEIIMNYAHPPYPDLKRTHKIAFTTTELILEAYADDSRTFTKVDLADGEGADSDEGA